MYFMINIRLSRDNMFSIYSSTTYLLDEVFFWKYTVDFLTAGACIITVYRNCYSDASSIAVGVYSVTFMCCDTIRDQRFRK